MCVAAGIPMAAAAAAVARAVADAAQDIGLATPATAAGVDAVRAASTTLAAAALAVTGAHGCLQ